MDVCYNFTLSYYLYLFVHQPPSDPLDHNDALPTPRSVAIFDWLFGKGVIYESFLKYG